MKIDKVYKLILVIIASFLLFSFIYEYDNKYTHESTQGANGLLVIDEEDFEKYPVRYLVHGWSFYPKELLSPKDFENGNPQKYMYYTSIGENVNFSNSLSNTPHGSASYVLEIELPEYERNYALMIPEVFSSYELYINDELLIKMGENDPKGYEDKVKNKFISFYAKDEIRIIVSVSDFSHFYSGMIYPMIFGEQEEIYSMIGIKLGVRIIVITLGILSCILSLYMGIKLRYKNSIIFSIMCLGMCIVTSYPIVHTIFELPIFPWYLIEISSGYIVIMMIVILHNRICSISEKVSKISNYISIIFCIISIIYVLFSSRLSISIMNIFSYISYFYKILISIYIIYTSYSSYYVVKNYDSRYMLYASVIYFTTFIWNLIYPLYEPIYGGWFSEWASVILVVSIGYTLWIEIISTYKQNINLKQERNKIQKQLYIHKEYAKQISQKHDENKKIIHDFRQHIIAIDSMVHNINSVKSDDNKTDALINYINQIYLHTNNMEKINKLEFCKNPSVNSILAYYYSLSQNKNIRTNFELYIPENITLDDVELCTIIGNLCENAVEACDRHRTYKRYINISTKVKGLGIVILIENSYDGKYNIFRNKFVSSKSGFFRMGIGLDSITDIINRHKGKIDIYPGKDKFRISVYLPFKSN